MQNYVSYGAGIDSTAMLLVMYEEGVEFEAVFVDHGCDWPETYKFVNVISNIFPVTVIKPNIEGFDNLYDYCMFKNIIPSRQFRWCSDKFKTSTIKKYIKTPCFMNIGFDMTESKRAILSVTNGVENRFPLIERELSRDDCKAIIKNAGLPEPVKSGCYFCCWQKKNEWIKLRHEHPDLFCKAEQLENNVNKTRKSQGKSNIYLSQNYPLKRAIKEDEQFLFTDMEYPSCLCGL